MQKSINPFDQTLLCELPLMNDRDIDARLVKAALTFESWKETPFDLRAGKMLRAAAVLRAGREEFARVISMEMGKALRESRQEVQKCADACEYYAANAAAFLADEPVPTEAVRSFVAYQPLGPVLAIMPWNFPFWQVFRFAIPALMAGNVGLLKHSSNVPQCALLLEKIFLEAGFPDGAFQSLLIGNDQVARIVASDRVHGVALTGSEQAGSSVASLAGAHIKKTVLELGGSDPFIVLRDADLGKAVRIATQSRMQNAGQSCIAAKRFIVVDEVCDRFSEMFRAEIDKLVQGNPLDEAVTTGPMARISLAEALEQQLSDSVSRGARLVTGGKRSGANFAPALLDGVVPGQRAFEEETFGPLAAVTRAAGEQEAIALANRSRFGLGASVWTADLQRGERVARQLVCGSVFVNSLMRSDPRLPFGGTKKSGYGRELSVHGIREFVNVKTIYVAE